MTNINEDKALQVLITLEAVADLELDDIKEVFKKHNYQVAERYLINALSRLETIMSSDLVQEYYNTIEPKIEYTVVADIYHHDGTTTYGVEMRKFNNWNEAKDYVDKIKLQDDVSNVEIEEVEV